MPKPPRKLEDAVAEKRPVKDLAAIPNVQPVRTVDLGGGKVRRVFKNLKQVRQWADKTGRPVRKVGETPDLTIHEATEAEKAARAAERETVMGMSAEALAREEQKRKLQEAREAAAAERLFKEEKELNRHRRGDETDEGTDD